MKSEMPPHIHIGTSKDKFMLKTFTAMLVPAFIAVLAIGEVAFYHLMIAVGTALGIHYLIFLMQRLKNKKPTYPTPYSPLVAAMIVGLSMPVLAPYWLTASVSALMILVFKYGQGYFFTRKYVNPAAAAKALLLVGLSIMIFLSEPLRTGLIFHPHHLRLDLLSAEGFSSVDRFYSTDSLTAFRSLILWKTHGWLGGVSGLAVLVVGTLLTLWAKLKWRIIVSLLLTMAILAAATGFITGGYVLLRIAFHVFTGSVIFLAFFMATEPQTTPMTYTGQYLFGFSLALLTFGLQLFNVLGGSIIALVILNIFTDKFDKIVLRKPYGHREVKT